MRGVTSSASPVGQPARRVLLSGAVAAAALGLSGCSIRLEDSAPEIPFIPTREPIPAEEALLWLLQDCHGLAKGSGDREQEEAAEPDQDAVVDAPPRLYEEQVAVLRTALYRAGIPIETLDEALTTAPGAEASAGASSPPATTTTPTRSQRDEAAALRRLPELVQCGGGLFPLVVSLLAQRWAAVRMSGAGIPRAAGQPDAARIWALPFLAVPFAQVTDAARYGFEVVTAQSRDETREVASASLQRIEELWREQDTRSGGRAPAPEFGYTLPFRVDSEESAGRLATHVIAGLIDSYGGLLPDMVGSAQEDAAVDLVAWLGAAAMIGTEWGVPLAAFPGSETPATP